MKAKLTKLNELQASLLIAGCISIVLLLVSLIGLFNNQPGWTIGVAIGSLVEFAFIWLMSVGSGLALKEQKVGLYLLTHFGRVVLFIGFFAALVVLQYVAKIELFYYSCWGMLIAFAPSTFITIAVQMMHKGKENG